MNTYVKRANLKGYRTIRDVNAEFNPGLNIIIGKNGSGKTNFMSFLKRAIDLQFKSFSNFESTIEYGGENGYQVKSIGNLTLKTEDLTSFEERVDFKLNIDGNEQNFKSRREIKDKLPNKSQSVQLIPHGINSAFLAFMSEPFSFSIDFVNYDSDVLFDWASDRDIPDSIRILATRILVTVFKTEHEEIDDVQGYLSNSVAEILGDFINHLNEGIKFYLPIEAVRWSKYLTYWDEANNLLKFEGLLLEFEINGSWLPFSSLSDGTKRLFFIYAEVLTIFSKRKAIGRSDVENKVILLEEPELGIHPHQFHLMMNFLKEMSARNQIIVTTHAPQALNILNSDELGSINICSFNAEQGTTIKKLDATQINKAKKYMEEMYLSDYWVYSNLEER